MRSGNGDLNSIDFSLASEVSSELLYDSVMLPCAKRDGELIILCEDPNSHAVREGAAQAFRGVKVRLVAASAHEIKRNIAKAQFLKKLFLVCGEVKEQLKIGANSAQSAVKQLSQIIFEMATQMRASDIHIEPADDGCVVRCRVDGMLSVLNSFDSDIYSAITSHIKMLANLDIAERRRPQDGRFSIEIKDKIYDVRVSTLPVMGGESVVMRILDGAGAVMEIKTLGFSEANLLKFRRAIFSPHGIVLVTGPTGSGKTTSLYAALNAIKSVDKKIISVEDPVEYQLDMIQQVAVNPKSGLSFAAALRAVLRQDPDIMMVGEIRDSETLAIAVQAALTGHLVLATLHTNDAASAIMRMRDMGAQSYLLSGTIIAVSAQRLVRKLCNHCKASAPVATEMLNGELKKRLDKLVSGGAVFYEPVGCERCMGSGYFGREAIAEVLVIDDNLSHLIARDASKKELLEVATEFEDMLDDGLRRAAAGITSLAEVLRVVRAGE